MTATPRAEYMPKPPVAFNSDDDALPPPEATPLNPDEGRDWTPDELADLAPPLTWMAEGLVPEKSQLVVAGSPKVSRKSWLCMALANAVSKGQPFLGFPTVRRQVVYVALEGSRDYVGRRWKALGRGGSHGGTPLDTASLITRFGIPGYERTLATLRETDALVVFDPLIRVLAHKGLRESDPSDMGALLYEHEALINMSPGASLVWVHHFRKSKDTMRGSSTLESVPSGWIEVFPTDDEAITRLEVTMREGKSGALGARFSVREDGVFEFFQAEAPARKAEARPNGERKGKADGDGNGNSNGEGRRTMDVERVREVLARGEQGSARELGKRAGLREGRTAEVLELLESRGEAAVGARQRWVGTAALVDLMRRRQS